MMWNLPISVEIDGKEYAITNKCDYRMVLDVICALNDNELDDEQKIRTSLYVFYEDISECTDIEKAIKEMYKIIAYGEEDDGQVENKPRLMDWEHDFPQIAPPVSRILGYDVRTPDKYTHWYTFLGGYMEIGECLFSQIVRIRDLKSRGKKLDKTDEEWYRRNRHLVDFRQTFTEAEEEVLSGWCAK